MSLGLDHVFLSVEAARTPDPGTPREVLAADEVQLQGLADEVRDVAARHALDDYGLFRLAVHAIDGLPIERDGVLRTVGGALRAGGWSPASRVLAVAALLRVLGVNVVPHDLGEGRLAAAVPVAGDVKALNANVVTARVNVRRRGGRAPEPIVFRWLLWDGGRLGAPARGGQLVVPLAEVVDGPEGGLALARHRLPAFTLSAPEPQILPVHGRSETLTWNQHHAARAWLALAPALHFPAQVQRALSEAEALDLGPGLDPLRSLPEGELVDTLLRTVQDWIRYEEGPLRSLFDILHARTGDCDQLSLVLLVLLHELGVALSDLRALQWPGHLALALRPRTGPGPGGTAYDVAGAGRFHALDAAYIHRTGDELTSGWGMLHERYARQRCAILALT